jgi:hypothetical protein
VRLADALKHADRFAHNFRTNAVSGHNCDSIDACDSIFDRTH